MRKSVHLVGHSHIHITTHGSKNVTCTGFISLRIGPAVNTAVT